MQAASDQAPEDRRRALPSRHPGCDGRPPLEAFPDLATRHRPYSQEQECAFFQLSRVGAYLTQWEWRHQVDSTGKISLANRNHVLGPAYRGQVVKVRSDPATREFVCRLATDEIVARHSLDEVSVDYILGPGV